MSAVCLSSSFVSFPPTVAIFFIVPSMLITSTINFFVILLLAGTLMFSHVTVLLSFEIFAPAVDTNFVPSGTLSVIVVIPSTSPVFSTVIVYNILSPTLAISFCLLTDLASLIIALLFSAFIIAVFVSLLSFPFAIAIFDIVPVTFSSTFTVNSIFNVSPTGIVAIHFTPFTSSSTTTLFALFIVAVVSSTGASLIATNVVFVGILSVISIFFSSLSPVFFTVILYISS